MFIEAGNARIDDVVVLGETRFYKSLPHSALRIKFNGGVTAEQLADLAANDWRLMEGDVEQGVHTGYNVLESHEATFIKTDAVREENEILKTRLSQLSAELAVYKSKGSVTK
jgi:BMFP domain-containing protein YqiC